MPESIIPILEAMQTSHQQHLDRLLRWKASGGRLEDFGHGETIDDLINRERLAISRCGTSLGHVKEHAGPVG